MDEVVHRLDLTTADQEQTPVRTLGAAISDSDLVLVLDHLDPCTLDPSALDLLVASCPALTVVLARRGRFPMLKGIELGPLPVPAQDAGVQDIGDNPAAALFVASVRRIDPEFAVTTGNVRGLVEVCRAVGGLPLALNLLAARVGLLGLNALATVLRSGGTQDTLALVSQPGLAPAVGLPGILGQSVEELPSSMRELLSWLACFLSPVPVEAILASAARTAAAFVDDLQHLIDLGLVEPLHATATTQTYQLLPVVRAVVRSRIPEEAGPTAAYVEFLTDTVDTAATALNSGAAADAIAVAQSLGRDLVIEARRRLTADPGRGAVWLVDCATVLSGTTEAADLGDLLDIALAAPGFDELDRPTQAALQLWSASLLAFSARGPSLSGLILPRWEQAMALIGDDQPVLGLRGRLIGITIGVTVGQLALAATCAAEGEALALRTGQPVWAARFSAWIAAAANSTGHSTVAGERAGQALLQGLQAGDTTTIVGAALILHTLPDHARPRGLPLPSLEAALELTIASHQSVMEQFLLAGLTKQALDNRDPVAAAGWCARRLGMVPLRVRPYLLGISLVHAAFIAQQLGDPGHAAVLFGAVHADRGRILRAMAPETAGTYDLTLGAVRAALGSSRTAELMAQGAVLTVPAAATTAVGWLRRRETAAPPREVLTQRESQVLAVLATGLTNKEIAAALSVSVKTVMHHTVSIFRKLDVRGRAEATAFAHREGLVAASRRTSSGRLDGDVDSA